MFFFYFIVQVLLRDQINKSILEHSTGTHAQNMTNCKICIKLFAMQEMNTCLKSGGGVISNACSQKVIRWIQWDPATNSTNNVANIDSRIKLRGRYSHRGKGWSPPCLSSLLPLEGDAVVWMDIYTWCTHDQWKTVEISILDMTNLLTI